MQTELNHAAADVLHKRLGVGYRWRIHSMSSLNFSLVSEKDKKGTAAQNKASIAAVAVRMSF